MKVKLKKLLRSFSAHYITSRDEPIISLLIGYKHSYYEPLYWALGKGYVETEVQANYDAYFFTKKGMEEILKPMQDSYCISGRKIR